ncbi:MAG: family 10 glycosylhydrolase [Pirellulales bacterium]|nr:family 10 glycosylhydrolase [Pirellulales bacterium]
MGIGFWTAGTAAAETVRIRIAWGGGSERVWRGAVTLSEGSLSEPKLLGIEADESGSMWVEGNRLTIAQRSPRTYDGVDLAVDAPPSTKLLVYLTASQDQTAPSWIEVPLADAIEKEFHAELDDRGNRLSIRRAAGDVLRVRLDRPSLVFGPGEILTGKLEPSGLPTEPGSKVRLKIQLVAGRGSSELWSTEHALVAGDGAAVPLDVRMPANEGVYDVVITATHAGLFHWPQTGKAALGLRPPLAERKIQVLVLGPNSAAGGPGSSGQLGRVVEIDPANPKWWERFAKLPQLPKLPRLWKGPLGNGRIQTRRHALGDMAQLAPSPGGSEASWEAYTLPIDAPGRPHVLEVDYPSDLPQTMGISLVEPNAAGAVIPIGLDSGVDLAEEIADVPSPPRWLQHRVIFWPRTKSPIVLITNRRSDVPALFGKIRVLAGWDRLPKAFPVEENPSGRLLAAYMDRPLLPENFSASESLGSLSDLSVDDWATFYESGTRLVEYLDYVGYNGLMLSVLADGSSIYPSRLLEPTPRYDTGVFFTTGQDPVRKDVLEMLLRLFDRRGLRLIPAIEYSCPLPELEAVLRAGGPESEGIAWIGPDGKSSTQVYQPVRGMAAYYNVLHPQVQESMLAVLRELISGYANHPSFAGLSLQLCGYGYAQLPGPQWGMDDATIAHFHRDKKIAVPGEGPERFARRAAFLAGEGRAAWLEWRAQELGRFYHRIRDELQAVRPEAPLYLAGANLFAAEDVQRELMPALPRKPTMSDALLRAGIDVRQYEGDDGIVLLRPEVIVPRWSVSDRAADLDMDRMPDWQRAFEPLAVPGNLFFHRPQELRLAGFDEASPFRPTYTWLATQTVPSGQQNRRRFVHALASLDSRALFDGGWMLPMGQEDHAGSFAAAYRRLPPVRFEKVEDDAGSQPVTVRSATHERATYAYAANTAPFEVRLQVRVAAPAGCQIEELTGRRRAASLGRDAQGAYWSVELEPYDLVAVRFSMPGVKLHTPAATWPGEIRDELARRIAELGDRATALRNPPALESFRNPGFEEPPAHEKIPGWAASDAPGVKVALDANQKHGGNSAVRLFSGGPVASLVSKPFEVPPTGRISMSVWLRVADPAVQPRLRMALEGHVYGQAFFRSAEVGRTGETGVAVPPIQDQWAQFVVNVNDLPLEGLSPLHARFDLIGPGEVWVDDIQMTSLAFSKKELVELFRLIAPADVNLEKAQVADCIRVLEGYWPQFLEDYVPLPQTPISRRTAPPATGPPQAAPEPSKGILSRVRDLLPEKLRF